MIRAPHLHRALRSFCLGAFAAVLRELDEGDGLPFSFEEHQRRGRPTLYEYRPLVRPFLEARVARLATLTDAKLALAELEREPAARRRRAHADGRSRPREALVRTVLLPLLEETAEACGGFDWSDEAFERAYARLEASLYGTQRPTARWRRSSACRPARHMTWVEACASARSRRASSPLTGLRREGLLPEGFEREPDRLCVLELEQAMAAEEGEAADAPGEFADAITALRLATAGPIAAGPVLFERLDWRPYGIRPVLPIAATAPSGEPVRIDSAHRRTGEEARERLLLTDEDRDLGEALDRWELSLYQSDPFASEQLRGSLTRRARRRRGTVCCIASCRGAAR